MNVRRNIAFSALAIRFISTHRFQKGYDFLQSSAGKARLPKTTEHDTFSVLSDWAKRRQAQKRSCSRLRRGSRRVVRQRPQFERIEKDRILGVGLTPKRSTH